MTFNEYQTLAKNTLITHSAMIDLAHLALGLNGEAGEVAEKVKKVFRDKLGNYNFSDQKAIMYELGDVLWYTALMADLMGFSLEQVAKYNINKLKSRKVRNKIKGSGDYR